MTYQNKTQDARDLGGLLICISLIALLLGGCLPRYCPPLAADYAQEVCECTTDIECETRCGGSY